METNADGSWHPLHKRMPQGRGSGEWTTVGGLHHTRYRGVYRTQFNGCVCEDGSDDFSLTSYRVVNDQQQYGTDESYKDAPDVEARNAGTAEPPNYLPPIRAPTIPRIMSRNTPSPVLYTTRLAK